MVLLLITTAFSLKGSCSLFAHLSQQHNTHMWCFMAFLYLCLLSGVCHESLSCSISVSNLC